MPMGDHKIFLFEPDTMRYYMGLALRLAHKAALLDEVPVGAIVVAPDGTIVGKGYNCVERHHCQSAHAELRAIEQAARKLGDWRLENCVLFVTLEPCIMCMGLIRLSRLKGVVYGATSPLFGYRLDNAAMPSVYKKDIIIESGVCAQEVQSLMKQFFNQKRDKKGE